MKFNYAILIFERQISEAATNLAGLDYWPLTSLETGGTGIIILRYPNGIPPHEHLTKAGFKAPFRIIGTKLDELLDKAGSLRDWLNESQSTTA